jgi:O-ureido-D-serine cyclo-ligase
VKPAVGAGSRDTRRHPRAALPQILAHMRALLGARRSVLLQPYLPSVDRDGETALIYLDGVFSHAIRKGPLLPSGAPATAALFAAEEITPRAAGADERAVAERILAALPFGTLLYARIDLIRGAAGEPRLLELEITEPSLFLAHAPGSAERLAAATLQRLAPR